jgi:hypothetical protein
MSETNGVVKPNLALAWKLDTQMVQFPSGAEAEMTQPDALSILTQSDEIPDSFFALIMEGQKTGESPTKDMSPAEMREFFRLMMFVSEQIAIRHFANPRIVSNPDHANGQISIDDWRGKMSMDDKMFLWNWAQSGGSPVDALSRFREEQAQRLLALQNGGSLS